MVMASALQEDSLLKAQAVAAQERTAVDMMLVPSDLRSGGDRCCIFDDT